MVIDEVHERRGLEVFRPLDSPHHRHVAAGVVSPVKVQVLPEEIGGGNDVVAQKQQQRLLRKRDAVVSRRALEFILLAGT